jgi:hypothetical protein
MSAKKVCINHSSSYYTGKEQSPLHYGLSAEGYDINSIMEGFDKDLWIVEVRNSKKVWTKKEHINKMTYEIPLITETVGDLRTGDLRTGDLRECDASAPNVPSVAEIAPSIPIGVAVDVPSIPAIAPCVSPVVVPSDTSDTSDTVEDDSTKTKEKVSKTVKPTDYTLFITYRIQQMKKECADNKKNYDCARYEWKEYKNKPDELRQIMIAARQYASDDTK